MKIERTFGFAPRTKAVAQTVAQLQGPCVGCSDCRGLCVALIEALTLPDVILAKKA